MPEATTTSATADENFSIRSYLGQTVLPAVSEALMDLEKLEERCVASRARPQFAARDRPHHRSLAAAGRSDPSSGSRTGSSRSATVGDFTGSVSDN